MQEKPTEVPQLLEVDDFEEEGNQKSSMGPKLPFPIKFEVTKILYEADRAIARKMFKLELSKLVSTAHSVCKNLHIFMHNLKTLSFNCRSTVWRVERYGNYIELRDIFNILKENDTSSSVRIKILQF